MNTINQTDTFSKWLKNLKDIQAKVNILKRIKRMENGLFGDCKSIEQGLFEMRIDVGQGYRVYYFRQGETIYLLISGGNKSTQQTDIKHALQLKQHIQDNTNEHHKI